MSDNPFDALKLGALLGGSPYFPEGIGSAQWQAQAQANMAHSEQQYQSYLRAQAQAGRPESLDDQELYSDWLRYRGQRRYGEVPGPDGVYGPTREQYPLHLPNFERFYSPTREHWPLRDDPQAHVNYWAGVVWKAAGILSAVAALPFVVWAIVQLAEGVR